MTSSLLLSFVLVDIVTRGSVCEYHGTIQFFDRHGNCVFIIACGDADGAFVIERAMCHVQDDLARHRLQDVATSIREAEPFGFVTRMV